MNQKQDVVFEISMSRATVTFHQNGAWSRSFGFQTGREYHYERTLRSFAERFVDRDDRETFLRTASLAALRASFHKRMPLLSVDIRISTGKRAAYEWYRFTVIAPINDRCNGTLQNIQAEKEAGLMLQRQAERDSLTDLLNRSAFDRGMAERFAHGVRLAALLIVDIDDFKKINDTHGHQYGDSVILEVSQRLRAVAPPDALIGRFGGDEYMMFLSVSDGDMPAPQFKRMVEELCEAATRFRQEGSPPISIGASFYPADGNTPGNLLRRADQALYYVKQNGKNNYAFYHASMPRMPGRQTAAEAAKPRLVKRRHRKSMIPIFVVFVALLMVLGLLANGYLTALGQMIRADSLDYLYEISRQIDTATAQTLNAFSGQIKVIADDLTGLSPEMSMDELCTFLARKSEDIGLNRLAAIDEYSLWHTVGQSVKIPQINNYIAQCVRFQQIQICTASGVEGRDYMLILAPVSYATSDGTQLCALAAFLPLDLMHEILSLTAFDGLGHADILTTDGRVVVRAHHDHCIITGNNLFTSFRGEGFLDEDGFDAFYRSFTSGESGSVRIVRGNVTHIIYYSKLRYQNWMLLTSVPANALERRSQAFIMMTVAVCAAIALLFCVLIAMLIATQRRSKVKLERLAYVDKVTGSATKERFRLDAAALLASKNAFYSIIYTNVDRFKVVNDRLGVEEANALLRYVAQVLDGSLDSREAFGRLDSDHFGVLVCTQSREEINRRIRDWNLRIAEYPPARQAATTVSMSYGVYVIDEPTLSIDLLLDRANLARVARRQTDDNPLQIFYYDDALRERLLKEQFIEDHMEEALAEHRFQVYLQPQFAADTERLVGFEALARWQTKDGDLLPPGAFIPVFERNGFIVKLDMYMFEQVCRMQRELMAGGREAPHISFNVSRLHLNSSDLLAPFLAVWEKYNVPRQCLEFEFTESVISDNPARLKQVVEDIHRHGFRCSMDDFGAGYSSLNALHDVNVDVVKIDKSFLGEGDTPSDRSKAVLRSVVLLARGLGITTVCEGVEYAPQAAFLKEIGCDVIQGFLYGKPMPAAEALELLRG